MIDPKTLDELERLNDTHRDEHSLTPLRPELVDALIAQAKRVAELTEALTLIRNVGTYHGGTGMMVIPVKAHERARSALNRGDAGHQGDPCVKCGASHDNVAVGPCSGNRGEDSDG